MEEVESSANSSEHVQEIFSNLQQVFDEELDRKEVYSSIATELALPIHPSIPYC